MYRCLPLSALLCSWLIFAPVLPAQDDAQEQLLKQAGEVFSKGDPDRAIELATQAIKIAPDSARGYLVRGAMYGVLRKSEQAVDDLSQAVKLNPRSAEAYQQRGQELFKMGKIDESIRDFDKYLQLKPEHKASHWQRGISYYLAGRYKEGKEQFEGYQTFDNNDVENAIWRYLCMVPLVGKTRAQQQMLKINTDKRVPMQQIYDLYRGQAEPDDVLRAAKAGDPSKLELTQRLFYAYLYLGLYCETEGQPKKALEYLTTAATDHAVNHYMWDVARVYRNRLALKMKKGE